MPNRARDLLNKCLEEERARARAKNDKLESLLKNLEEEIQPFLKAVEKFAKTKEVDADALKIDHKELITESDQENAGPKKGSRRKKMPTVSENTVEIMKEVSVKKEKISAISEAASTKSSISSTTSSVTEVLKENIKSEKDEMPAPSWIPPKKKAKEIKTENVPVRTTRTKGKKAEASKARDSDIIIQDRKLITIDLSDLEEPDAEKPQRDESTTRSTRTKTRKQTQTVDSGTSSDAESTRSTRTKTRSKKDEPNIENEVEEVRSTRTKTLRKGKKVDEEIKKDETEESQPEVRTTRTKTIRKGKEAEETNENNVPNNNIDLEAEPTRSTRTKTRKQAKDAAPPSENEKPIEVAKTNREKPEQDAKAHSKRNRSEDSAEEELVGESKERKKSKSNSPPRDNRGNTTTRTVYEDARSTLGPPQEKQLNATFVSDKPEVAIVPPLNSTMVIEPGANCTVVVDHPKYNIFDKKSNNDLFTDDESIEVKTPPKKAHTTSKCTKEVFSPYEKTTLKKKVEAFEKLQNVSEIPIKTSASVKSGRDTPSSIKEKAKIFTPSGFRFQPGSCSTSKISRFISSHQSNTTNGNDSLLGSTKSGQKDPRERQKKIMEREQALKKKETMLLAQAEAKRKLNEEKQLKAQQQRKVLEAEKLKQLELQKQKEERLKQREQEREEYLQKQKQELEKKRLAQKKKIQELQAQRQQAEQSKIRPVYMVTEPPHLPTYDCYDSDDPEYKKAVPPSWCNSDQTKIMQLAMLAAGEKIKNTLFCRHAQTPDLVEIFEGIDPKKLKRSSSILWRKPPRYTMMPDLNETRFSDDEELYDSD